MNKLVLIVSWVFLHISLHAQDLTDIKKDIYYDRPETAKAKLKDLLKDPSASTEARYWLGEIYLKQQKTDSAAIALEVHNGPAATSGNEAAADPLLTIGRAHFYLDSGNPELGMSLIEAVLQQRNNKNTTLMLAAAKALISSKAGDPNRAIDLLLTATKKDKKNAELYMALGDAYKKIIDGSRAIPAYDKALELNPGLAAAMFKKGMIYKSQNNAEIYLDRFLKAYNIDSNYTPVLSELYYYYFFRDVKEAARYLHAYIQNADQGPQCQYMLADLNYISKNYEDALRDAEKIFSMEKEISQPRLYKLIANCYAALGDSVKALSAMDDYFLKQDSGKYVAKDFELKAKLLQKLDTNLSHAVFYYRKALEKQDDQQSKLDYMVTLAELNEQLGNRDREAVWREKIYTAKERPSNIDLYKWGISLYAGQEYKKADSVFSVYETKYPQQIYGYLWRARCNAMQDSTMEKGLAVEPYLKFIDVATKDSLKNRGQLIKAYGYLAMYEANITRNFNASLAYFEKILALDPSNDDANKYIDIIRKWISEGKGSH